MASSFTPFIYINTPFKLSLLVTVILSILTRLWRLATIFRFRFTHGKGMSSNVGLSPFAGHQFDIPALYE